MVELVCSLNGILWKMAGDGTEFLNCEKKTTSVLKDQTDVLWAYLNISRCQDWKNVCQSSTVFCDNRERNQPFVHFTSCRGIREAILKLYIKVRIYRDELIAMILSDDVIRRLTAQSLM